MYSNIWKSSPDMPFIWQYFVPNTTDYRDDKFKSLHNITHPVVPITPLEPFLSNQLDEIMRRETNLCNNVIYIYNIHRTHYFLLEPNIRRSVNLDDINIPHSFSWNPRELYIHSNHLILSNIKESNLNQLKRDITRNKIQSTDYLANMFKYLNEDDMELVNREYRRDPSIFSSKTKIFKFIDYIILKSKIYNPTIKMAKKSDITPLSNKTKLYNKKNSNSKKMNIPLAVPTAPPLPSGLLPVPTAPPLPSGLLPVPTAPITFWTITCTKAPKLPSGLSPVPKAPKLSSGLLPVPTAPPLPSGLSPVPKAPKLPSGLSPVPKAPKSLKSNLEKEYLPIKKKTNKTRKNSLNFSNNLLANNILYNEFREEVPKKSFLKNFF